MAERKNVASVFLILGFAFIAIGASVNRAFIAAGIAFIVIALVQRSRR
jgi:hypothetical protein